MVTCIENEVNCIVSIQLGGQCSRLCKAANVQINEPKTMGVLYKGNQKYLVGASYGCLVGRYETFGKQILFLAGPKNTQTNCIYKYILTLQIKKQTSVCV